VGDSGVRALWSAVVDQAKFDIETAEIGSATWITARDFLTGSGDWAASRHAIADMIDVHADDLREAGLRWVRMRCLAEGVPEPPLQPPPAPAPAPKALPPLPRLEAIPARPKYKPVASDGRTLHVYGGGAQAPTVMPPVKQRRLKRDLSHIFSPHRALKSER
jgi:hypothetical protein